jgi:hypothetical protein
MNIINNNNMNISNNSIFKGFTPISSNSNNNNINSFSSFNNFNNKKSFVIPPSSIQSSFVRPIFMNTNNNN